MTATGFGYAQARIQARHGQRPDTALWRRLSASRELGHLLETARSTSLRPWLEHMSASHNAHEIERSLRADFRAHVRELATWVPEPWQPAVLWTQRMAVLPFVVGAGAESLLPASLAGELSGQARRDVFDAERELAEWRSLWPKSSRDHQRGLDALVELLAAHRQAMATVSAESDGWILLAALEARLCALFRQRPEQPVTAFCQLALTALDLERLRGALVRRALFADVESEVAWV